jgi:pimeloyl-ACP methyl ester carboxylesterase
MSVDFHPTDQHRGPAASYAEPSGPLARIVAGSLVAGLVTALLLALVVFAGASEGVITGSVLVGFGFGWSLIRALAARFTSRPQRWTAVPAAVMATSGIALMVTDPANGTMTALGWVWPAPMLALVAWMWVQMRRSQLGRARWLLTPVVAFFAVAALGATYENVTVVHDQHTYAAPGWTYDVGGHRLYLDCRGHGSPTVVLDNGLGEVAASWARIVDQVSPATRVCAWDRAGQGWSQDAAHAEDGVDAAADLHTLLAVAGEHGPFVLVGHSIGGPYAMTYAARYPDQVAGMVLLDSSSPEQFTALPAYPGQYAVAHRVMALAPTLSRLGLGRVVAAVAPSQLPAAAAGPVRALTSGADGARSASAEWQVLPALFEQAQALTGFGSRPLAVLTATESLDRTDGWATTQDRLAALSDNHLHQVVDSTHIGLLEDAHGATQAALAIDAVVASVRTGAPVHTP